MVGDATLDRATGPTTAGSSGLSFAAFVTFVASIMALNGLSIDSMLPALPAIGRSLGIADENRRQWIVAAFLLGFGGAQIVWGPLADRFGRKPILVAGLGCFAGLSLVAGLASSFPFLIGVRFVQGIAVSASRVTAVSIVRDCYSGRRMARVMSLSFMVFLVVPILAPSVGQLASLLFGTWRALFFILAIYGAAMAVAAASRLGETLHPEYRRSLTPRSVVKTFARILGQRQAIGYIIASAFAFGCVTGFIMSVEQIFTDLFHVPRLFPVLFAGIAMGMVFAALFNAHFVERLGTRRISHAALLGFILLGLVHLAVAWAGFETVVTFVVLQALEMFCFGLLSSNFNSMAMETVGDVAGSASSVQGFVSTCCGSAIGAAIGQAFDGSTLPLSIGFTGCGCLALCAVLFAERGRLFRPQHATAPAKP